MGSRTHVGQVGEKSNATKQSNQDSCNTYNKLTPMNEKQLNSKQSGSFESSNIAPTECAEITEKSSVSKMNTMTKMTAMRAILVNQASIYNASENGKMAISDCSSQKG